MKRIAMLSFHSCPVGRLGDLDVGGMNVYVLMLSKYLGRLGFAIDIFTRNHDDCTYSRIGNIDSNVRVIHIEIGQTNISKVDLYDYVDQFTVNVNNFSCDNGLNYHLIHSHYWLSGCVGEKLSDTWQINHLLNFHTTAQAKSQVNIIEENQQIRSLVEKNLFFSADAIITSTLQEEEDFKKYFKGESQNSYVIIPGVDLSIFHPVDKSFAKEQLLINEDNVVLFVGRFDPIKGIDFLIESFSFIKQLEHTKLLIVGGDINQGYTEYFSKIKDLGLEDKVRFEGSVNQDQLYLYYSASDVYVLASHYESFGFTILESMACKTPVISTRVGIANDLIKDGQTGFLINKRSPSELSKKIENLLEDVDLNEKMGLNSYDLVKGINWSKMALKFSDLYHDFFV
ncbi:MAG: glycosyltransferase family 1 protein [SAR202 cluster bacterium]|nr:glycosyltransferase family 1 protein [SAR202 cluster bacterium]|tara:strand:+ start:68192 stop:69385 length:1194 start_codon:yes stop_codon:yes gene_type:complete